MKTFCRQVDFQDGGNIVRAMDRVDVPANAQDADAWLTVMFGSRKAEWVAANAWFVACDSSIQAGAKFARDADLTSPGNFTNPQVTVTLTPIVLDEREFGAFICGLLDPDPLVGRSKLRGILEAAAARAGALPSDLRTRDFKDWFYTSRRFDKATVSAYLADLVASGIITNNQRNAVLNAWPVASA